MAQDCINQIDAAQEKITKYNNDYNTWDNSYTDLSQQIVNKEKEIDGKDIELYNWVLSRLTDGHQIDGSYVHEGRNGCGNWPGSECKDMCNRQYYKTLYKTPRGRHPSYIDYYHTYLKHCSSHLAVWETYRCYCKLMNTQDRTEFNNKEKHINDLIAQKSSLYTQLNNLKMPVLEPIRVSCCEKNIECNNKLWGPNACFGNLQSCRQISVNILDKSAVTDLEIANKGKIEKIKKDLIPVSTQIRGLLDSIYSTFRQFNTAIDSNNIENSINKVSGIYNEISSLVTQIDKISNVNNIKNDAEVLFNYITTDTTHKREMRNIFDTISADVSSINSLIAQAKKTLTTVKDSYNTLLDENININLLKTEQTKITGSIELLNRDLGNLKTLFESANLLNISSQENIDKLLEIYNKSILLVKNINSEIININNFRNSLTQIYRKFTIDSFFFNDVYAIYENNIKKIDDIIRNINESNMDNIIEKINNLLINNKNFYQNELIKLDQEKLKKIQDEELEKNKIIRNELVDNLKNDKLLIEEEKIINTNNIKQEASGININIIIFIVVGIIIMTIIFFYLKK
jgi:hypothetical protein